MRRSLSLFFSVLAVLCLTTSCIKDEEVDYTSYNQCSITAFSISDIETEFTTKNEAGEDSTYTVTTTGSDYSFTIDQLKREVYNVDSLPKGTDVSAVLCTLSSDGTAVYKNENDEWYYISSSDSIDFSKPLSARIWAYDGVNYKDYTIRINVHQLDPDSTVWTKETTAYAGQTLTAPRAIAFNNEVAVYGLDNGVLKVTKATNGVGNWSSATAVNGLSNKAQYNEATYFNNALYIADGGRLYTSTDGVSWTQVTTNTTISHLYGCNTYYMFAASDKTFITSMDGMSWGNEKTEYPEMMPTENVYTLTHTLATNNHIERTLLVGQLENSTDSCAVAWYRDTDDTWGYMYTGTDNYYKCPNLNNLTVLDYKEYLIAFGGTRRNSKINAKPFENLYVSKDNGLTWKTQDDENFDVYPTLPEAIVGNTHEFTSYVDSQANIWILFSGTGDVWKGRLNRMGFAQ